MAPNTSASLDSVLKDFSQLRSEFLEVNTALARMNEDLKKDNADLRSELAQVKAVVNRQAAYLAELDSELDSLCQYGRRENVVFSNLAIPDDKDVKPQVIKLCKELDVEISVEDIVDAHPLPSKTGPKKVSHDSTNGTQQRRSLAAAESLNLSLTTASRSWPRMLRRDVVYSLT